MSATGCSKRGRTDDRARRRSPGARRLLRGARHRDHPLQPIAHRPRCAAIGSTFVGASAIGRARRRVRSGDALVGPPCRDRGGGGWSARPLRDEATSPVSTAAFRSNRMYVPSLRRTSLRVRTITASCTVPFLMVPSGDASFTVTFIRSPRLAILPVDPPMGMIISTLRAPELSATSSEVCI